MTDIGSSDIFGNTALPQDASDRLDMDVPVGVHLHSPEEIAAMSHPVLTSYALRLQEAFRQLHGDNEMLLWEFREIRDNLTYFSRATKLAHRLNAADVDTLAEVAVGELPFYFGCRFAALFFRNPDNGRIELYRLSSSAFTDLPEDDDGFLGELFELYRQPFVVEYLNSRLIAVSESERPISALIPDAWLRVLGERALVFPLQVNKGDNAERELLGGLLMGDSQRGIAMHDVDMSVIFCDLLSSSLHNARLVKRLNDLTIIDSLTQTYNRRHLLNQMNAAMVQARRHGHPLSLAMLDIDHFKRFNDNYGHLCGDEVLRQIGAILNASTRTDVDTAARYGGEEFVLLMPYTDLRGAVDVAERLRVKIKEAHCCFEDKVLTVTASIGVAQFSGEGSAEAFVDRADEALYTAKREGRDRVCCL